MMFNLAGIEPESIVDGPGFRMAVFFQGCPHACPGCHNKSTWDFNGGVPTSTESIIESYGMNPLLSGVTLTGGDPTYQPAAATEIAMAIHEMGGDVWLYTGDTIEQLIERSKRDIHVLHLLYNVDVLVDGPFIEAQKDMTLRFRGSRNQRIIYRCDLDLFMRGADS